MPPSQGLLDRLSTFDERAITRLDDLVNNTNKILNSIGGAEDRGTGVRNKRTQDFSALVPGDDKISRTQEVPFGGWVDGFTVGWPSGASRLVGVRLEDNETGEKYFPEGDDDYTAMDDFRETFETSFEVDPKQKLTVVFKSEKSSSIDVPINALVQYKEKFEWEQ